MSVITDLIDENSSCHARIVELLNDASYYAARNEELRAELASIKAQEPVPDEREEFDKWFRKTQLIADSVDTTFVNPAFLPYKAWMARARLNAAPVQQVSVPDGWRELAKRADDFLYSLPETDGVLRLRADLCSMLAAPAAPSHGEKVRDALAELLECPASVVQATVPHAGIEAAPPYQVVLDVSVSLTRWKKARAALEAAAPAAPAADTGLVEALDYQALFDAIAAATSVYANGAINISVQAFRESLAAHSAEGVV